MISLLHKELLKIEKPRTETPVEKWRETRTDKSPLLPPKRNQNGTQSYKNKFRVTRD